MQLILLSSKLHWKWAEECRKMVKERERSKMQNNLDWDARGLVGNVAVAGKGCLMTNKVVVCSIPAVTSTQFLIELDLTGAYN